MSDGAVNSKDWPSPSNPGVLWTGGKEELFQSSTKPGIEPKSLLYRLVHSPNTGCYHQDKELPYYFNVCPYCGVELRSPSLSGIWLPPFGWSPFNGLSRTQQYKPLPVQSELENINVPGNGSLRFWILPLSETVSSEKSYLYAYRPNTGQIYYLPNLNNREDFTVCSLEGEKEHIRSLRSAPLGPARSWSVVWSHGHLFVGTQNGLLILDFIQEGVVKGQSIFTGKCLSAPALATNGLVYFLADREDGRVSIAEIDPAATETVQWREWKGSEPKGGDLIEVSTPFGVEGGDVHWVTPSGVIALEDDQGRWIPAKSGLALETRIHPWLSGLEMRVYGREKNKEFLSFLLSSITNGVRDADSDQSALPYPSAGAAQWFYNGQSVRYHNSAFSDTTIDNRDLWPLGSWQAEIENGDVIAHILTARFTANLTLPQVLGRSENPESDITISALTISNNKAAAINPGGDFGTMKLKMPLDVVIVPVGAETLLIYYGDTNPNFNMLKIV